MVHTMACVRFCSHNEFRLLQLIAVMLHWRCWVAVPFPLHEPSIFEVISSKTLAEDLDHENPMDARPRDFVGGAKA